MAPAKREAEVIALILATILNLHCTAPIFGNVGTCDSPIYVQTQSKTVTVSFLWICWSCQVKTLHRMDVQTVPGNQVQIAFPTAPGLYMVVARSVSATGVKNCRDTTAFFTAQ